LVTDPSKLISDLSKVFHFNMPTRFPNAISSSDNGLIGFAGGLGAGGVGFGFARAVRRLSRHGSGGHVQHRATPARTQANGFWRHLQCVRDLQVFVGHFLYGRRGRGTAVAVDRLRRLRIFSGMVCQCFAQMRCTLATRDSCDVQP
jgi:hypothetical protein